MISIIVCSVDSILFDQLEKNIGETIGCDFEVIRMNNVNTGKGICQVYNEGLLKVKGSVVCFCHEDIIFETVNWGREIFSLLSNQEIGLVGIAGAVYKSQHPTSWVAVPKEYYRVNMIQKRKDGSEKSYTILDENHLAFSEVSVLDGCFIAGRKCIFDLYRWNTNILKGFHIYDLDISMRVGVRYKIVIANNIKITHYSEGDFDINWLKESEKFHNDFRKLFPINKLNISKNICRELDYFAFHTYITQLITLQRSWSTVIKNLITAFTSYPIRKKNFSLLKLFLNKSLRRFKMH